MESNTDQLAQRNYNSSAYPVVEHYRDGSSDAIGGFTKLEKAALMIAQGLTNGVPYSESINIKAIATTSVHIAKAVLEEANK